MAHLKAQETQRHPNRRKEWKLSLIRRLYESGYSRRDVLHLFKFIDWAMILPEGLKQAFWLDLKAYEDWKTTKREVRSAIALGQRSDKPHARGSYQRNLCTC
ncbi:MAG: hypothetical protein KME45_00485 [Stenomitos rutilans HA7619-LM2]|jgi:hypothetical protein|nr:hypothetical protein [Stenomitos rutilans HA7619-LM2]